MKEVRCEQCGRLLAVVLNNGLIESRGSRQVVLTERALLSCLQCGGEVLVDGREGIVEKSPVDKSEKMR